MSLDRDGFEHLPGLLTAEELGALRAGLGAGEAGVRNEYGVLGHNLWQREPAIARVLHAGRVAGVAAALLGVDEVTFFQDSLVWKPPGAPAIQWHQDYSYWPLAGPCGLTLWLALDDATPGGGCLRYLPGTHRLGERRAADFGGPPGDTALPALDWQARAADAVDVPVRAGDAIAHHPLVWHGSGANDGPRDRRALSTTWLTPAARWAPERPPTPFHHQVCMIAGGAVEGRLFPRFSANAPTPHHPARR